MLIHSSSRRNLICACSRWVFFFFLVSKLATLFGLYLHRVFEYFLKVKESSSGAHTRHTRPQTFKHTHTHTSSKRTTRNMPDRDVTLERDNSSWSSKIEAVQQYSLPSDVNWIEIAPEIERERARAKDKERARVPANGDVMNARAEGNRNAQRRGSVAGRCFPPLPLPLALLLLPLRCLPVSVSVSLWLWPLRMFPPWHTPCYDVFVYWFSIDSPTTHMTSRTCTSNQPARQASIEREEGGRELKSGRQPASHKVVRYK